MLESGLSEIIPLICTSAIWGPYPVFTPWVPLGSPEGMTVVWALIEGRYSSPSQVPSGSLAHTGGLQLLMTVTSLVIDTTGNTTFLSSLLGGSGGAPKRTVIWYWMNEWVNVFQQAVGFAQPAKRTHLRLSGGLTASFIAMMGLPRGHLFCVVL